MQHFEFLSVFAVLAASLTCEARVAVATFADTRRRARLPRGDGKNLGKVEVAGGSYFFLLLLDFLNFKLCSVCWILQEAQEILAMAGQSEEPTAISNTLQPPCSRAVGKVCVVDHFRGVAFWFKRCRD